MSPLNAAQMLGKAAALGAAQTRSTTARKVADETTTTTQPKLPAGGVTAVARRTPALTAGTKTAPQRPHAYLEAGGTSLAGRPAPLATLQSQQAADKFRKAVSEHSTGRLHDEATGRMEEAQRKLKQFHETQPDALAPSDLVQWKSLLEQLETAKNQVQALRK